jgi:hypothetical protein
VTSDRSFPRGLRFTRQGPINEDLGVLMSAVLRKQLRRSARFFVGFAVVGVVRSAPCAAPGFTSHPDRFADLPS